MRSYRVQIGGQVREKESPRDKFQTAYRHSKEAGYLFDLPLLELDGLVVNENTLALIRFWPPPFANSCCK